mgnify:CR=1 FL=1
MELENKMSRRSLAAIMFADMVGYTRLMQKNETQAKLLRDRQRAVVDSCIPLYGGSIMQYYGDGTLSMFPSAIKAVEAAQEIQLKLQDDPKVPLESASTLAMLFMMKRAFLVIHLKSQLESNHFRFQVVL